MYAIVNIQGQQFKVEKDQEIFVHRLAEEEGASVKFDEVLLLDNKGKATFLTGQRPVRVLGTARIVPRSWVFTCLAEEASAPL